MFIAAQGYSPSMAGNMLMQPKHMVDTPMNIYEAFLMALRERSRSITKPNNKLIQR